MLKRNQNWINLPALAGHWRAPVAVTHPLLSCGGSTPSRRTFTYGQVAKLVDARLSESRSLRECEFESRLGYYITQRGRCPADSHKVGAPGSIPGSAIYYFWAGMYLGGD